MWSARGLRAGVLRRSSLLWPGRLKNSSTGANTKHALVEGNENIFEPWTEAYDSWTMRGTQMEDATTYYTDLPCVRIRELVLKGEFERAEQIRDEFFERGIPIAKHAVYEVAALEALKTHRRAAFRRWWAHVPDRALVPGGRSFDSVLRALVQQGPWASLSIIKFILMAAGKGWLQEVHLTLVPYVVHHAPPTHSLAMLAGALENARRYQAKYANDPSVNAYFSKSSLINCALQAAVVSGRRDLSILILELGFVYNATASTGVLRFLLQELTKSKEVEALERARKLIGDHVWVVGKTLHDVENHEKPDKTYLSTGPLIIRDPLPILLRTIKSRILSNVPPHASAISHLLVRYTLLGRVRAINILRRRLTGIADTRPLSLWGTAEMKLFMMYGIFEQVVLTYVAYFKPVGISKTVFSSFVKHAESESISPAWMKDHPHLDIIKPINVSWKLWPSSHAQSLLWSAIARLAPNLEILEFAYQGLLKLVRHFNTHSKDLADQSIRQIIQTLETRHNDQRVYEVPPERIWLQTTWNNDVGWVNDVPLAQQEQSLPGGHHVHVLEQFAKRKNVVIENPLPEDEIEVSDADAHVTDGTQKIRTLPLCIMPDAAHFMPFVIRFGALAGPRRALEVVQDMGAYDIAPSMHTWYFLAREYARRGDITAVLKLLSFVESLAPPDWITDGLPRLPTRSRFGPRRSTTAEMVGPTMPFYMLVLRSYAKVHRWNDLDGFLAEMEGKGYRPGMHPRSDVWIAQSRAYYVKRLQKRAEYNPNQSDEVIPWKPPRSGSISPAEYMERKQTRKRYIKGSRSESLPQDLIPR